MTRARTTLLIVVAAAAVMLAAAALLVPRLLDGERYRRVLEERASSSLGSEVRLGAIHLSVFPRLAVRVDRVEVADPTGGGDLLVAESLRLDARLRPLLRGRLDIDAAVVDRPRLLLTRGADGAWNMETLFARAAARSRERENGASTGSARGSGGASAAARSSGPRLTVDRLVLKDARVTIADRSIEPLVDLVLDDLDLTLDGLETGQSVDVVLDTGFDTAPQARVRWSGTTDLRGAAGEPAVHRGRATFDAFDTGVATRLARLTGVDLSWIEGRLAAVSGDVEIEAALPDRATLRGDLDLGTVEVALPAAEGSRDVAVELSARFDLETEDGADLLRIATLAVDVDDTPLVFAGTIEAVTPRTEARAVAAIAPGAEASAASNGPQAQGSARRVDLTLLPTLLSAARLAAFLALALPELPFSFSSPDPIALEGRIHGIAGSGRRLDVDGRIDVADLRFEHDAMSLPLEHISASVGLSGDEVTATGVAAVIGDSDLRGEISIEGFARPRARFDLSSRRANLEQLFGALERGGPSGSGSAQDVAIDSSDAPDDLLARVEAEGRIRVEQASWGDLAASDLDATLRLDDGTVTLDPLAAQIYGGRFTGRLDALPGQSALRFELRGAAEDVRVESFLAGALDLEDRLTGRFSGTLQATGSAGEWAQVARSLEGRGEMRIEEGEVASFPLLGTVARVSGVFGQEALAEIAGRLADSATRFTVLSGSFRLGGGALAFESLTLQSRDYTLVGTGTIDLVQAALRGDGAMTFSAELSELMRAEDSRAAELFSTAGDGRVRLPLELRGALSDPDALVDWQAAVRGYAERRIGREIERGIGELLGRVLRGEPTPTPTPTP